MARHLQLPHDLNSDHQRALAPQWMTDHHDSSNSNRVPAEKGSTKRPSDDTGSQRHDKGTWRSEERPSDKMWGADKHGSKPWGAEKLADKVWGAADQFHHPQPERFAPQGPKPARKDHQDFPPPPAKGNERWRDDGQSRRSNTSGQQDPGTWGSPAKGSHLDTVAHGENWNRSGPGHGVYQRPSPGQVTHRADAGRWNAGPGKWDSEDHHHAPARPTPWEGPKLGSYDQGKDAARNGQPRNFMQFGRGKPIPREPQSGAASNRWVPSMLQHQSPPSASFHPPAGPAEVLPTKLGGGPQKHKYTIEQLLSIYVDLSERKQLEGHHLQLDDLPAYHMEQLPASETQASLLLILNDMAQQMVEEGFASKAERRLASRLNALVESSGEGKPYPALEKESQDRVQPAEDGPLLQPASHQGESFLDGLGVDQASPFSAGQTQDVQQQQAPPLQAPVLSQAQEEHQANVGQSQILPGPQGASAARDSELVDSLRNADEWFYRDPKGEIQGPYNREAIKTWNESGYFPPQLPLATSRSSPQWHPLSQLLVLWKTPRADSFLPHQASGQAPHAEPQSAASRMLEAAETGNFGQNPTSYTAQAFSSQSTKPNPPVSSLQSMLQMQGNHISAPLDRGNHSFHGQQADRQMSHHASNPIGGQLDSQLAYQLQQRAGTHDLPMGQHLLGQQMNQRLGQGMNQQISNQQQFDLPFSQHHASTRAPEQNMSGLSALDLQLQSLGLQSSRPFEQSLQEPQSARTPGGPGVDLLSRLQGHARPRQGPVPPATLQADPIVDLLGTMSRDSHSSSQNLAPIGPQTSNHQQSRQRSSNEHSAGFHLDDWMAGRSTALSELASQDLQSHHSGYSNLSYREPISASLTEPSFASHVEPVVGPPSDAPSSGHLASELRPEVDQVIQPKPKAAISAVGPPPKKFAPPPPARLAESARPGPEVPAEDIQGAPFQKVQKQKRKEQTGEAAPAPVPPAVKAPQPRAPAEPKPPQEVQRGYTLGEAAGLVTEQPEPNEPPSAPWAGQAHSKGPRQKTLLEIQREEAEQAKIRAEVEAAQAAAQASVMPAAAHSSWAKPLSKPAPSTVTSFTEIQEQESRQRASMQPPPPPPAAAQHQWGSTSGRDGKTLANRLSQSLHSEAQPSRSRKAAPPRAQLSKPSPQPASQDDDELFWDPRPASGPLTDSHRNGGAQKPSPHSVAEESVGGRDVSEAEGSLSPEFADWCRSKLRELRNGDDDLNLILFLMTVGSNAEIAEYMTQFFGRTSAVAAFSNEFIKRKLVEQSGKKKSRKQKSLQTAASESRSGVGVAPLSSNATGWSKLPKKKKKGQKMDGTMLGFGTGTNYAALEKLEQ